MKDEREGKFDEGHLRYRLLRTPEEAPPIVIEVFAPRRKHWNAKAAEEMVGQTFGLTYRGRVHLLAVVAAQYNPLTRRLELTCR